MNPPRSAFGAPPHGGAPSGPAKPVPRLLLGALSALLLASCSPPPTASLFPLEGGHRWAYSVVTDWENNVSERETRVITTEGDVTLSEVAPPGPAWVRRSADGVQWYLRADDTGVYRVAAKTDLEEEPQKDKERRYVLKAPLRAGTAWQASTPAYLLKRRQEFPQEIRHSHQPVVMTYTIESLEEKVQVPAGNFEKCLRVKGSAVIKLFADPVVGWRELPLTTQEWYCHGPGLVKLVREEPANSTFLVGGKLTMELQSWQ